MINVKGGHSSQNEETIGGFRGSYNKLIAWIISRIIAEKNINRALDIAEFYGGLRWENFDGIYQDNDLEGIVELKVRQSQNLHLPDFTGNEARTILIASALYDSGGHARVVLNWMKAFKEYGQHRLLITRLATIGYRRYLEEHRILYHLCASGGIELINEILVYCADAQRIVLHTHPDDIITAIAARILGKSGKTIIFFNHADHVFSFGLSAATVVCEISRYGIELNKRTHRVKDYSYLGIPIDCFSRCADSSSPAGKEQNKTVFSGGPSYKYAPGESCFSDLIDNVLEQRHDVSFLLAGPTGKESWWIEVKERWGNRIQFLGVLSHSHYLERLAKADVYVDSFPISGGTAFPEALLSGRLVTALNNPIQGYSPADALRLGDVQQLSEEVIRLLNHDPISMSRVEQVRERAMAIHSIISFHERVEHIYAGVYDKNAHSEASVDTHWSERRWENGSIVSLPNLAIWYRLPLRFCIAFTFTFNRLFGFSQHKNRWYLLRRMFVKPLPGLLRSYARNIYNKLQRHLSEDAATLSTSIRSEK
jgi:hypothetical protein